MANNPGKRAEPKDWSFQDPQKTEPTTTVSRKGMPAQRAMVRHFAVEEGEDVALPAQQKRSTYNNRMVFDF